MVRAAHLSLLALCGLALGCPAGPVGQDIADARPGVGDAPDEEPDAPTGTGGLVFQLVAAPALPGVATGVTIDEARVWLRDFRAIGDSAPGDSRTSVGQLDLDFRTGRDPPAVAFPLAPPGVYSQLAARLDQSGGRSSFELRGHVTVGGRSIELHVQDEGTGSIAVALGGLRLDTGTVVVSVKLDLAFLGAVNWAAAPRDGDKITLGGDDAISVSVRASLAAAFSLR